MVQDMADPIEIVLEFLKRNQFDKAEAAFRAELFARSNGENPVLSSENVLDWDLQLRECVTTDFNKVLQGIGRLAVSTNEERSTTSAPGKMVSTSGRSGSHISGSKKEESGGSLLEGIRPPPEKQLYVEYESGQSKLQESMWMQKFASKNNRMLSKTEAIGPFAVASDGNESASTLPSSNWVYPHPQQDVVNRSLPSMPSASSSQFLPVGKQGLGNGKPAEQAFVWEKEQPFWQQDSSPTSVFASSLQSHIQDQDQNPCESDVLKNEVGNSKSKASGAMSILENAKYGSREVEQQDLHSSQTNFNIPIATFPVMQEQAEGMHGKMGGGAKEVLLLKNGFITGSTKEGPFKNVALKTFLPVSFVKPSQSEDEQRSMMLDYDDLNDDRDAGGYNWNSGYRQ